MSRLQKIVKAHQNLKGFITLFLCLILLGLPVYFISTDVGMFETLEYSLTGNFITGAAVGAGGLGINSTIIDNSTVNEIILNDSIVDIPIEEEVLPVIVEQIVEEIKPAGVGIAGSDSEQVGVLVAPTVDTVVLNTTDVTTNDTSQNVTLYFNSTDGDLDSIKNITSWLNEGSPYAQLILPFEGGSQNGNTSGTFNGTRDYANNFNVTIINSTYNSTGGYDGNGAYEFDGINDFLRVENFNYDGIDLFSLSCWVKLNQFPLPSGTDQYIFSGHAEGGGGTSSPLLTLYHDGGSDNFIQYASNGTGNPNVEVNINSWSENEWHHLVAVSSIIGASYNSTVFLDGENVGSNDGPFGGFYNGIANLTFGAANQGGMTNFLNGTLDDCTVYHEDLSSGQVVAIYNNRTDLIVSQNTERDDIWAACVTPNDGTQDGATVCSSNVTILNANPIVSNVVLNTTNVSTNVTTENVTLYYSSTDSDIDPIKNITNWYVNGTSITVLNMPFEKINGTTTNNAWDYSGNGNNGSVSGAVWNATGGHDGKGAYEFDGSSDFIATPVINLQGGSSSSTIEAWVKPDSGYTSGYRSIFYNGANNNYIFQLLASSGEIRHHIGSTSCDTSGYALAADNWTHVTGTYDGSNIRIYVNGQLARTCVRAGTISDSGGVKNIGRYPGGSEYFLGTIDNFKLYNKTLSPEQILALYNNRTDLIVSNETTVGDNWSVCVTPNDGAQDGSTVCSNNVTILSAGAAASSCGTITTNTTLINNVTSAGTCFTIGADNVVIDCAGYSVNYGTNGTDNMRGVSNNGYENLTVRNCNLIQTNSSGSDKDGIYVIGALNNAFINNTITTSGSIADGIWLGTFSNNSVIENNTITSAYVAIYLDSGDNLRVIGNTILATTQFGLGLGTTNSYIYNNDITGPYALAFESTAANNTLHNNNFSETANSILINDLSDNTTINYLVYNNTFGELRWNNESNGSILRKMNLEGYNITFPGTISIINNSMAVDISALVAVSSINSSVSLQFFNVGTFVVPTAFESGAACGNRCTTPTTISNGYTFNATFVGNFSMGGDTVFPTVNITNPTNNSNLSANLQSFNVDIIESNSDTVLFMFNTNTTPFNVTATNVSGNWNANVNVTTIVEGAHVMTVFANDTTNNINQTETISFTIDRTAPVVTIVNSSFSTTNTTPSVTFNFSDNIFTTANCSLYLNGTFNVSNSTTAKNTNTILTVPNALSVADYNATVSCIDSSSNSGTSNSINITITSIPECGTITTNTTLINNLTSTGTCISFGASNIELDCAGYSINYSTAGVLGYGVNISGFHNNTVKNCMIYEGNSSTNLKHGVYLTGSAQQNTIQNNTIIPIGGGSRGIFLTSAGPLNILLQNNITSPSSSAGRGITFDSTNGGSVINNTIVSSSTTDGLSFQSSSDIFVSNNVITTSANSYAIASISFYPGVNNITLHNNNLTTLVTSIYDASGNSTINYFIYNNSFGQIEWINDTNGSFQKDMDITGNNITLGGNIQIQNNSILVDTTGFTTSAFTSNLINSSVKLQFFNVGTFVVPTAFESGAPCGNRCTTPTTISNGYTFNATFVGNFSVGGDEIVPAVTITNPINNSNLSTNLQAFNATIVESNLDSVLFMFTTNTTPFNVSPSNISDNWSTNLNITNIVEGVHIMTVFANDTSRNINQTETVTFRVDRTAPVVTIINVSFNTTNTTPGITFNMTDNLFSTVNCSLYLNGTFNVSNEATVNNTNTVLTVPSSLPLADYNATVICIDSSSNSGTSNNITISITTSDSSPTTTLSTPAASYTNTSVTLINLTFECNATDDILLQNISLYLTNSTNESFSVNQTSSITGITNSSNWTIELGTGNYTWNCLSYDNASQSDWGVNRTIGLSLVLDNSPNVTLSTPNSTFYYNTGTSTNVSFECNVTDDWKLQNVSLYLTNSSDESFSLNQTTLINGTTNSSNWTVELGVGNYTWNCLAYDNASQSDWDVNRTLWVSFDVFTVNLSANATSSFQLTGRDSHNLTLNSSTNTSAEATFQSDPIALSLTIGSTQNIAAESTTVNDFSVTLDSSSTSSAVLTVRSINIPITISSTPSSGGGGGGSSTSTAVVVPAPAVIDESIIPQPSLEEPAQEESSQEPTNVSAFIEEILEGPLPLAGAAFGKAVWGGTKRMFTSLSTVALLSLLGILFVFDRRIQRNLPATNITELVEFMQNERNKGTPQNEVHAKLLGVGWTKTEIEEAFKIFKRW